jgi:hypothetical protein
MKTVLMTLSALAMIAAAPSKLTAETITVNAGGIPPWEFATDPGDNWRFFPLEWQTLPLSTGPVADFELTATLTVGDYNFREPPYNTEDYCRFMEMAQFHFQGGLVLRDQGPLARYRLQFSVKEKCVALWKTPGNFLAVVDCDIAPDKPFKVSLRVTGNRFEVSVDGKPVIDVVDRIAPLATGRLLAGANHAKLSVTGMQLNPLPSAKEAVAARAPAHVPRFAVRPWCGQRWIFDGVEPIACFSDSQTGTDQPWYHMGLTSVKYRPGTRSADLMPLQFRGAGTWPEQPIEVLEAAADRVRLRAVTTDRTKDREPTVKTVCDVTLTYDAARDTYVYTSDSTMTYLAERSAIVEILDPWPYSVSGPAPGAGRPWDVRYTEILWRDENGGVYRYPLNHFLGPTEPRLSRENPLFCFAGEQDVNPTYEILPPSVGKAYKIGLCTTMLDLHVQRCDLPKTLPAGTVQKDSWRSFSTHGAALAALKPVAQPHPVWNAQTNALAALFDPKGTHFSGEQVVSALVRHHAQAFSPFAWYTVDPDVGHADKGSLRLDLKHGAITVKVGEGLSYFGTAFTGRPYRLRLYAKTSELAGTFRVSVVLPGNRVTTSEPLAGGTTDWRLIELRVEPKPGDYAAFINLEITGERGGKGQVWVDDASFLEEKP